jgi:gamma-glutamyltranspeptidase / glutathione hydrolase
MRLAEEGHMSVGGWHENWSFDSRRSPVFGLGGVVATSQPLAAQAGLEVLQQGGNAADAAVSTGAALAVTEPCSTGLGGDMFALFFDASTRRVHAINGHGRAPAALSLDALRARGIEGAPDRYSVHSVTVPGAAAGWADTIARHGRMDLGAALQPAIRLAERGFPVTPVIARHWSLGAERLRRASAHGDELLVDGRAPRAGEIWRNPGMARTLCELAEGGPEAFYGGRAGRATVEVVQSLGGWLEIDDLAAHESTFESPISTRYRGYTVYECPPSGQGLVALLALNILEGCDIASMSLRTTPYLHTLIEAIRLAFEDGRAHIADPAHEAVPAERLLSPEHAAERRSLIDPRRSSMGGGPMPASDTVYASIVDGEGNACSFINSNYNGFGTAIVPEGCGFTLQNRGAGFVYEEGHPNSLAPRKRPLHTIMPAMSTDPDGELHACFGVMGGWHQPQGHVQVFANLVDHGLDPQRALDEPRFSIYSDPPSGAVYLEEGVAPEVMGELARMGHRIIPSAGAQRVSGVFGRGQIIVRDPTTGALAGGSDPRGDGAAVAF